MNNYVPFLKLKVNEIGALKGLDAEIKKMIVPFFDFPQKVDITEDQFIDMIAKSARKIKKNLSGYKAFYLDNFDISDKLKIAGKDNYEFVIDSFSDQKFIPVLGLDRALGRSQIIFAAKKDGRIISDTVALRLLVEDFEDFDAVVGEISDLADQAGDLFDNWVLIFDNRMCLNIDTEERSSLIAEFIQESEKVFSFDEIIVTGSSIPASIKDIVSSVSDITHDRAELAIYRGVTDKLEQVSITLGDYTIVSPLYSDLNVPPEALRNVTAPKIVYSYEDVHYIERGGSLKSHARGSLQYNDIALNLIGMHFYRGAPYSYGDNYIYQKANFIGTSITPSSILNPTINAHITYMCIDFIV